MAPRKRKYKRKKSYVFTKKKGPGLTRSFPFKKSFVFKTRYVDSEVIFNPNQGIASTKVYNLTSLFDPEVTGGANDHKPIGFKEIMPLFDHYTIIGARCRVTFANKASTASQLCMLHLKDSQVVTQNTANILENGMTRYALINAVGGNDTVQLSMNFSSKTFFGKSPMDGDVYRGTITTNPNENCYLHVTVDAQTTSDDTSVKAIVMIEYIAILTEPKMLSQSN